MLQIAHSLIGFVILFLLTGCGVSTEPFQEPVVLEITPGASSIQIAEQLTSHGVISSKWPFLILRVLNNKTNLQAGEYVFEQQTSASQAFKVISEGHVLLHPITIREGLNRFDFAETLATNGLANRDKVLDLISDPTLGRDIIPQATSLEGFLFPETYLLAKYSTAEDLIQSMLNRFRLVLQEATEQRTVEIDPWEALILASMIEKEAVDEEEAKLVASVFHNRINKKIRMQCDPTIIYGLLLENRFRGKIYLSDLKDPHPYNTYIHSGLPPGPITNPGKASLFAAFAPAETDYLFFVAKPAPERGHQFSKSNREHNRGVQKLRQSKRSK